jgi:hypothetical protein
MDNKKVYFQIYKDRRANTGFVKLFGEELSHGQSIIIDFDSPSDFNTKLIPIMFAMELVLGYRPGFYLVDENLQNPQFAGFYSYDVRNFLWK